MWLPIQPLTRGGSATGLVGGAADVEGDHGKISRDMITIIIKETVLDIVLCPYRSGHMVPDVGDGRDRTVLLRTLCGRSVRAERIAVQR